MSVLEEICARRRVAVAADAGRRSVAELRQSPHYQRNCVSLSKAVQEHHGEAIVAEHKRSSPSEGSYGSTTSLSDVVRGYASAGAVGLSILTEPERFGGLLDHLREARELTDLPLLRKDFIVDTYQIEEAKAAGADAILLIAAGLTQEQAGEFCRKAQDLGLEVLLEIHDRTELDYLAIGPNLVGVNNRDLGTLNIDLDTSLALITELPTDLARLSESGIGRAADAHRIFSVGYDGLLIGTHFMKSANPGAALAAFLEDLRSIPT